MFEKWQIYYIKLCFWANPKQHLPYFATYVTHFGMAFCTIFFILYWLLVAESTGNSLFWFLKIPNLALIYLINYLWNGSQNVSLGKLSKIATKGWKFWWNLFHKIKNYIYARFWMVTRHKKIQKKNLTFAPLPYCHGASSVLGQDWKI